MEKNIQRIGYGTYVINVVTEFVLHVFHLIADVIVLEDSNVVNACWVKCANKPFLALRMISNKLSFIIVAI